MPLTFDDRGLLPPGLHDATLADVDEAFARFQKTDRRINLFERLKEYLAALSKTEWVWSVLIDGSFVMPKVDEPEDIDLVLVLPADWDATAILRPFEYNLVSKARVRKEYQFDMFAAPAGSELERQWIEFFGGVNVKWCERFGLPNDSRKGLVRVSR